MDISEVLVRVVRILLKTAKNGGITLVAVEASLYKFGKLLDYAEHVEDRLSIHGVEISRENFRNPELETSVECKYLAMSAKNIAGFIVHGDDPWAKTEFALLFALPFLAFAFTGGGRFSVDALLRERWAAKAEGAPRKVA